MQNPSYYSHYILNTKTDKLCIVAILLLLFYKLFGWIFTKTIYSSPIMDRILVISILGIFTYILINKKHKTEITGWTVYIIVSIIGFLLSFNIYSMIPWFAYFVILALALNYDFISSSVIRFVFLSGLFALVGVYVQFFFPSFYVAYIERLFQIEQNLLEDVVSVEDLEGMRGFTYQSGNTSNMILYSLIVFLYLKDKLMPKILNKNIFIWSLVTIMIIAIFFTGKRMISALAIIVPLMTYYLSSKSTGNKIVFIIVGGFSIILAVEFLIPVLLTSFDFFAIRRLAETYESSQSGVDITTGRISLWEMAIEAWKEHPLFGIGIGKFKDYTGAFTSTHNTYLQVLCEQGVFGFILYIIAIISGLIYNIKILRRVNEQMLQLLKMSLAFQLIYILYAFSGNVNSDSSIAFLVISMALTMHINYIDKIQKIHSKRNLV